MIIHRVETFTLLSEPCIFLTTEASLSMALYICYTWSEKPNEAFILESFSSMRMTSASAKQDEISSDDLLPRGIQVVFHCYWDKNRRLGCPVHKAKSIKSNHVCKQPFAFRGLSDARLLQNIWSHQPLHTYMADK